MANRNDSQPFIGGKQKSWLVGLKNTLTGLKAQLHLDGLDQGTTSNTMGKGTKLYSIFFNTCPRCQRGSFFTVNNPYNLKRFDQMNPQCSCCGERFEREPGYYTGALYVSYAYYTALIVVCFILFQVIVELDFSYFLTLLISLLIGLTPVFFRLARLTWINFFIGYDAHKSTHCP